VVEESHKSASTNFPGVTVGPIAMYEHRGTTLPGYTMRGSITTGSGRSETTTKIDNVTMYGESGTKYVVRRTDPTGKSTNLIHD
jgi:hypothetical protein